MNAVLRNSIRSARRQVRVALAGETACRATVAVGVFLWVWLLTDWMIEPAREVRVAAYTIAGGGLLAWLLKHSLSALLTRLPDEIVASWIEQRRPELGDALLTVIGATRDQRDSTQDTLLDQAEKRAAALLESEAGASVVGTAKLRPWMTAAALLVASLAAWAAAYPEQAIVFVKRLALTDTPWPRRVVLSVEDFVEDGHGRLVRRVARDAPFELDVKADLTGGHISPREVRATMRMDDGSRRRIGLAAVGQPTTGDRAHQAFRMKLDRLRQDLVIYLRGGDGRLGPLRVEVVSRPAITDVQLEVDPPGYLNARGFRQSADAAGRIPEGSSVMITASANKPLHRVAATLAQTEHAEPLDAELSIDRRTLSVSLPQVLEDGVVELSLLDADRIESESPFRIPLRVQRDAPPRVEFSLVGVGRAITPDAVLPTRVTVEDDHAIAHARQVITVEEKDFEFPLDARAAMNAKLVASPRVDLLALRSDPAFRFARLEPGLRVKLRTSAADHYDLGPAHTSVSQTETLTVVTADELVARLEERERNLRQTFEQVYDEARGAQLTADRLDQSPPDKKSEDAARGRRLAMARLVERLSKVADETNAVAEGFRAILDELINNRIPNDDLRDRIELRIVRPLRQIVESQLPDLRESANAAASALSDDLSSPALPTATRDKLSALVRDMEKALAEMKAVETYNEVLAMLRGIIDDQREITRKTDNARKSSLKRLLLE